MVEVFRAMLSAKDEDFTDDKVRNNRGGAGPPNEGVADGVDLAMILDPEVLANRLLISREF